MWFLLWLACTLLLEIRVCMCVCVHVSVSVCPCDYTWCWSCITSWTSFSTFRSVTKQLSALKIQCKYSRMCVAITHSSVHCLLTHPPTHRPTCLPAMQNKLSGYSWIVIFPYQMLLYSNSFILFYMISCTRGA